MSSSTTSYNPTSNTPCTPKNKTLTRSSSTPSTTSTSASTSTHIHQFSPKPLTLMRSLSASSTSSTSSFQSRTSQPSSPFLEPPFRYESRHPSELTYRRMSDSPKPHYFYERPGFFIPKRLAPKAPGSPRAKVLFIDGVDVEDEEDD
ncbi:52606049-742c-4df1-b0bd-651a57473904-CDS [Sclerotinia trifoliorum]|uniref:52606049-742c-4df1-b0bd-651a57473904-CDS n=1 Tax=Sclerotinia trifoliorum TaxID=28548 RepID=A0A8H2VXJ4_9HELO|nr:52606049-742c-4df1-b0bd-651a57473904-CDS [Sclerotinia trifoliorum]